MRNLKTKIQVLQKMETIQEENKLQAKTMNNICLIQKIQIESTLATCLKEKMQLSSIQKLMNHRAF
jgi:hypothetical protein